MNPERLLQNFDRLIDTPDAVPRLRRFILDLAVRGKLVEQNPEDEPAATVVALDIPFNLPSSWHWKSVGDLGKTQTGSTPPTGERLHYDGDIPFIKPAAIKDGIVNYEGQGLTESGTRESTLVQAGAILMVCIGGTIGKAALVARIVCFNQQINSISPSKGNDASYLLLAMQSSYFQACVIDTAAKGTLPIISKGKWERLLIPLPPLAEQQRIVAKVDELMKLCDELEAAQAKRERRRDRLVAATLHGMNNGAASDESGESFSFEDSARFYFKHLPRLTTRPEHIQQLRQTILNLAVRGKLVAQNPKDESVAEFLKRIESEKTRLSKEGQLRGDTSVTPLDAAEGPFVIPSSWAWVPFGDIMVSRDGERIPVSKEERNGRAKNYDYYGASGVIDKIDTYLFDKPLLLIGEDGANLINRSTPIAFIARGKYWVNNHAHVLDGISEEFLRFIELHINAIDLKPYVTGTAQPKMNQAKMNSIPIALPPEDEQHRIVAKVDALMALCDDLERQITTHTTTSRKFLETTLQAVLQGRGMHECTFQ